MELILDFVEWIDKSLLRRLWDWLCSEILYYVDYCFPHPIKVWDMIPITDHFRTFLPHRSFKFFFCRKAFVSNFHTTCHFWSQNRCWTAIWVSTGCRKCKGRVIKLKWLSNNGVKIKIAILRISMNSVHDTLVTKSIAKKSNSQNLTEFVLIEPNQVTRPEISIDHSKFRKDRFLDHCYLSVIFQSIFTVWGFPAIILLHSITKFETNSSYI